MGTISNALTDFDMGLSLNEEAINRQLEQAWWLWTDDEWGRPFNLSVTPLNASGQPSSTRLEAQLGTPQVLIGDESTGVNEALTRFPLIGGNLRYFSDGQEVKLAIDKWTLTLRSTLNRRMVSLDDLRDRDETTARDLEDHFARRDLSATDFSIECLFLNLTRTGVVTVPQLILPEGTELSIEASMKLAECLATWIATSGVDGRNGFLLGTSVMPSEPQNKAASFSLSDYALRLSKTDIPGVASYHSHTLDYLGVVHGGLPMPAAGAPLRQAREKQGPWVAYGKASGSEGLYAGALLLRKDLFLNLMTKGISDAFRAESNRLKNENKQQPGKHPEWQLLNELTVAHEGNLLLLRSTTAYKWRDEDVEFNLLKTLSLKITLAPGDTFAVEGELVTYLKRDRVTSWDFHSIAHAKRTTPIEGTMFLSIKGEGIDALIEPQFKFVIKPSIADDKGETSGFVQFLTRINNSWDVEIAGQWLNASTTAIITMLETSMDNINVGMDSFACIPPGNGTFTFQGAALTEHMDLTADVIYVGPAPSKGSVSGGRN